MVLFEQGEGISCGVTGLRGSEPVIDVPVAGPAGRPSATLPRFEAYACHAGSPGWGFVDWDLSRHVFAAIPVMQEEGADWIAALIFDS